MNKVVLSLIAVAIYTGRPVPASATEIIAATCPEGVFIVADKRITYLDGSKRHHDNGNKIKVAGSVLVAACGYMNLRSPVKLSDGSIKVIEDYFDTLSVCAQAIWTKHSNEDFSTETINVLARDIGNTLVTQLSLAPRTLELENSRLFTPIFLKATRDKKHITMVYMDVGTKIANQKRLAVFSNEKLVTFTSGKDAFWVLGSPWQGLNNINKTMKPRYGNLSTIRAWSEEEILASSKMVKDARGVQSVGTTVDEYLVCYDGSIKRLALGKSIRAIAQNTGRKSRKTKG